MTSKELVLQAISRQSPSRTPCICPGGMMNMIVGELQERCGVFWPQAHSDPSLMADLASAVYTEGVLDNIGVPFCMTVEAEAMGSQVDLGDQYTEPRVTAYAVDSVRRWQEIRPIDLTSGRPAVVLESLTRIKVRHPSVAVIGNLTGPISLASSVVDAAVFYKELRKLPEEAHALLDFVTEQLIRFGKAQIAAGADIITISDPSGTGEILGPKQFERFALPYLNRITEALRPLCSGVIVHICGRLQPIYPLLEQLKSDVISVDSVVRLENLKAHVPSKAVMGNISTVALELGSQQALKNNCRACLEQGVDILAPACGLGTHTKLSSLRALITVSKEHAHVQD